MHSLNDLVLRSMREDDLEMVLEWRNSESIRLQMINNQIIEQHQHYEWFDKISDDNTVDPFIAEFEQVPIGVVSITDIDKKNGTCTWGMYIGDEKRNSGIGILMQIQAIDRMINHHGIRKIWGQALSSNRILKMHDQFGFVREGALISHIERNGEFEDLVLVALFAEDWPKNRQSLIHKFNIIEN